MINLNVAISNLLKAVQACSSSPVVRWLTRILALSQAFAPSDWPTQYNVTDGEWFDFVVVGAGSAGAIVAARLSEVPDVRVLLVEAGGDPPLASVVPSLFATLPRTEYDWDYTLLLDKDIGRVYTNQSLELIRGKMLGGCSSNNYEFYMRGEPTDYDEWSEIAPGWEWSSVLYYFKKLENMTDVTVATNPNNSYLHSTEGPVKISRPVPNVYFRAVNENTIRSYEELGLKRLLEANGPEPLGVSLPHYTFSDGRRSSTAEAYLRNTKEKRNLYVAKYTRAVKILIDPLESRAYGMQLLTKSGTLVTVYATKEVIVSAGSIDTPKLLMLSGVGPKTELEKLQINSIVDLPVGSNLHDHSFVPIVISGKKGFGSAIQNVLSASELDAFPVPAQNAFVNVDNGTRRQLQISNIHIGALVGPIIQFACQLVGYKSSFCSSIAKVNFNRALDFSALLLLHPLSRGRVSLRSNNPLDDPIIESGFLRRDEDVNMLLKGVKFMQRLVGTSYYKRIHAVLEKLDVTGCNKTMNYEDYWRCYIKSTIGSLQHTVGTCAMGPQGVVDERLRVHGVSGLRVVDASIMPDIPGGNTNAPTMMIGEKGADMIKEDYGFKGDMVESTTDQFLLRELHELWSSA